MSDSAGLPVIAGLAVGVGFIVILSLMLTPIGKAGEPTLILITVDDGKDYSAYFSTYCNQICDFAAYSRVIPPDPPIHISKESGMTFRVTNAAEQPKEMQFFLSQLDFAVTHSFDPTPIRNGKYFIPGYFGSGEYIMDVLAYWDNTSGENQGLKTSLHRFRVVID